MSTLVSGPARTGRPGPTVTAAAAAAVLLAALAVTSTATALDDATGPRSGGGTGASSYIE